MRGGRGIVALIGALFGLGAAGVCNCGAELLPSAELRFVLTTEADTVTVGDAIPFVISGAGPIDGTLLLPVFADSLGPFSILDVAEASWSDQEEQRGFVQEGRLALFATGEFESPRVQLLWVPADPGNGDTLVAYASPLRVVVRSLLPESLDLSNPQAALAELREVKDVVVLRRDWTWAWVTGAVLLAAALLLLFWKRRRRTSESLGSQPRPRLQLAPEVAFGQGLDRLRKRELLEDGEVKHYYAGLSLLLRAYLEGRFLLFAVEATREEILPQILTAPQLEEKDRTLLRDWLTESDLVKYAKLGRGEAEARDRTASIEEWVQSTTEAFRLRATQAAAKALQVNTGTSSSAETRSAERPASAASAEHPGGVQS